MRPLKSLNIILFLVILALVGWFAASFIPQKAAAFPEFGMEGLSSAGFEGDIFAVNIFASWCAPCRAEHPTIMALAEHIPVYGIAHKDTKEDAGKFLEALGNPYVKVGYDHGGLVAKALSGGALPATFIVTKDLDILWQLHGPINDAVLEERILPLIEPSKE